MEHTSSQNWFWPEWPCSWIRATQFSCSVRPKRGNLESCGAENIRARLGLRKMYWIFDYLVYWKGICQKIVWNTSDPEKTVNQNNTKRCSRILMNLWVLHRFCTLTLKLTVLLYMYLKVSPKSYVQGARKIPLKYKPCVSALNDLIVMYCWGQNNAGDSWRDAQNGTEVRYWSQNHAVIRDETLKMELRYVTGVNITPWFVMRHSKWYSDTLLVSKSRPWFDRDKTLKRFSVIRYRPCSSLPPKSLSVWLLMFSTI